MGPPAFSGASTHARNRASQAAKAVCNSVNDNPSNCANRSRSCGIAMGVVARSFSESGSAAI